MSSYYLADLSKPSLKTIRGGFGQGLKEAAEADPSVVGLCADLTGSTNMNLFAEAFADRFFEVGVAEQNLVTVASGLACQGHIPFAASYAAFNPGRNWEQIRTTVCLNQQPVKIVGAHAGISVGPDGATHQMLEDIALMRVLPTMVVIAPADYQEARKATLAMAADRQFPGYLRLAREAVPEITTAKTPFEIGKAYVYRTGHDVSIIATGTMTYQALVAANKLAADGISAEVIHCPTIKPLDQATILASLQKTNCAVTVEEHQASGGLGSLIAETSTEDYPVPIIRIGIRDVFGQSGTPEELLAHYGLTDKEIVFAAHSVLERAAKA